jgi:DNA topoisomerase-1
VWISPDRDAHLLAHGVDAAGRTQYRYHPEFRRAADATKFARMSKIADRLPRLRAATRIALGSDDERERIIALVTHLIDRTLIRVGTERYADENDSYGACTLLQRHIHIDAGTVAFDFRSKGGVRRRFSVCDQVLAAELSARRRPRPSSPILVTSTGWTPSGTDLADFLTSASGIDMTAKDLRTWGATSTMVGALCAPAAPSGDPLLAAYDVVAARLGNTRTVARASYVAPGVVDAWESGELGQLWSTSRASARFSRAERTAAKALLMLSPSG